MCLTFRLTVQLSTFNHHIDIWILSMSSQRRYDQRVPGDYIDLEAGQGIWFNSPEILLLVAEMLQDIHFFEPMLVFQLWTSLSKIYRNTNFMLNRFDALEWYRPEVERTDSPVAVVTQCPGAPPCSLLEFLSTEAAEGDLLIVGLNGDWRYPSVYPAPQEPPPSYQDREDSIDSYAQGQISPSTTLPMTPAQARDTASSRVHNSQQSPNTTPAVRARNPPSARAQNSTEGSIISNTQGNSSTTLPPARTRNTPPSRVRNSQGSQNTPPVRTRGTPLTTAQNSAQAQDSRQSPVQTQSTPFARAQNSAQVQNVPRTPQNSARTQSTPSARAQNSAQVQNVPRTPSGTYIIYDSDSDPELLSYSELSDTDSEQQYAQLDATLDLTTSDEEEIDRIEADYFLSQLLAQES
ncbi:hypothetical protein K435DRAFT_804744 [Dendrothele bispora CBS 962.96]|uniref:Uncharacterized protein n=1 Tax=Dendrothele bispora (strain CBS 962.96) TaxID=1314807 RepID=A0A4S8LDC3_DENBC|nr:hypothetical protein K435DRAFT_804744 [Dendrothele bispora CBS 962.96]